MLKILVVIALLGFQNSTFAAGEEIECNAVYHGRLTPEAFETLKENVAMFSTKFSVLREEVSKIVIGQEYVIDRLLIGLLSNGHVLLEGVPGVAKTRMIKSLSEAVQGVFSRIQFTSDLLPSEITGTQIYDSKSGGFITKKGPIFANFVLADEINRAPSKVQGGTLQVMEEKTVTIGENTYKLEKPFLLMATQNPIEQQGVYPLPEAQMDRFLMKVKVGYPSIDNEMVVINQNLMGDKAPKIKVVMSLQEVLKAQEQVEMIVLSTPLQRYIATLVAATRDPKKYGLTKLAPLIQAGASPRGSIGLAQAARAYAFLRGSVEVTVDDVKAIAKDVLSHRITLSYEGEVEHASKDDIVDRIIAAIKFEPITE